ncbi:MAG: hypothetical protein KDN19_20735, partial [Verrucomicrobiae bacterium]|nr:hypothetical protein [Verrucomicrobiae bacterium]
RSFLRFLVRAVLVLLTLVVLLISATFLLRGKIGAELKTRLDAQLQERGINVEYTTSDFAPFRGLTIKNLKIFRDASRQTNAVTLSEAHLRYDLLGILRGKSAASVQLTTDGAGLVLSDPSGDYAFEDLETNVSIDRAGTEIREFSGLFRDIRFHLDGDLGWEGKAKSAPGANSADPLPDPGKRVIDLSPISKWLDYVPDTPDGEAELELTISRPGYPAPMTVKGQLSGDTVRWRELTANDVAIEFDLVSEPGQATSLSFPKCQLTIDKRKLDANGSVDLAAGTLTLKSISTGLNPASFASLLPENSTANLPSLPPYQLEGAGTLNLKEIAASQLAGKLTCDGPAEVPMGDRPPLIISSLSSDFSWNAGRIELSQFSSKLGKEKSLSLAGDFTVQFPAKSEASGGTVITFPRLQLTRGTGSLNATGSIELAGKRLSLEKLDSGIDIGGLLTDLGFQDPISAHAQFPTPPTITASGDVALGNALPGSKLAGTFQAPEVRVPAGENRIAELKQLDTKFALGSGKLTLTEFRTSVFDGALTMPSMSLGLTEKPVTFLGRIDCTRLRLASISDFLQLEKRRTGSLTGFFDGSGNPDLATLTGNGRIEVTGAEFGTVPLFHALRPLLSAITLTNWRGETEGANLTSTYAFDKGVMKSEDIKLDGDFYAINAATTVDFGQRTLDANGRVSTSGATKVLTQVVGKALEIEASGTFDNFSWKLKNVPGVGTVSDLTGLSKDLLGKTLGAATSSQISGAIIGGVKDTLTSGKPVRGAANMAEDTVKSVTDVGKKLFGIGRKKEEKSETPPAPSEGNGTEPESGN